MNLMGSEITQKSRLQEGKMWVAYNTIHRIIVCILPVLLLTMAFR